MDRLTAIGAKQVGSRGNTFYKCVIFTCILEVHHSHLSWDIDDSDGSNTLNYATTAFFHILSILLFIFIQPFHAISSEIQTESLNYK
jgi:hypothetical protein